MFKTGDIVDNRYEIKEKIGSGGGGIIYKAYHRNMRKDVALKLIKDASAEELENRFEIDLMKNLKSRYLPIFYDFVQNGDEVYTVMEYIDGHDIKRLVEMEKNFSEDEIVKCGIQLCEAAGELHSKRPPIIHGDIKPANVMITATGDVCLIDFNISAIMQGSKAAVKGYSKEYAAPEQTFTSKNYKQYVENPIEDEFHEETRFLLNETPNSSDTYTKTLLDNGKETEAKESAQAFIDFRTDIFGIGAVLYYMLTGHPPINGKPDFSDIEVSAKLERIITKAMAAIPDERYKNTEEMKADLYSKSQENYKSIPAGKGNGKLFAGIACAAAAVVIFIIGCIGWKNSSSNIAVAQGKVSEVKSTTTSVTTLSIDTSVAETAAVSETTSLVTESTGFEEEFENPVVEYEFDSSLWGRSAEEIKNIVPWKYDDSVSNERELNYYDVNVSDISEFDGSFFSRGSISKHYYFDYKLPDYDNVCADGLYKVMYYVRYDNKAEWESAVNDSLDYFTYIYGESEQIDSEYFGLSGNLGYKHWVDESTAVCLDTWSNQHIMVEYVSIDAIDAEWLLPVDAGENIQSITTKSSENIVTSAKFAETSIATEATTVSEYQENKVQGFDSITWGLSKENVRAMETYDLQEIGDDSLGVRIKITDINEFDASCFINAVKVVKEYEFDYDGYSFHSEPIEGLYSGRYVFCYENKEKWEKDSETAWEYFIKNFGQDKDITRYSYMFSYTRWISKTTFMYIVGFEANENSDYYTISVVFASSELTK